MSGITKTDRLSQQISLVALKAPLLLLVTLVGAGWLYAHTAAPSVLSGDSGEFQFAAPLLGVPHPTGYPLYIMLGKLATLLPISDIAHRVTLVSALAGAGTVALLALLLLRVTGSLLAALIAAVALAVAPGLWHLSTIAEVYTLNTLLLTLLALMLWQAHAGCVNYTDEIPKTDAESPALATADARWIYAAACVTGLGMSHHGSFAFIGTPLFMGFGLLPLLAKALRNRQPVKVIVSILIPLSCCFLLGLTPWLLVLVQYVRLGPFTGTDHGLPRAYFWGAPAHWSAALSHLAGGTMRSGVFDLPGPRRLFQAALTLWERLQFEFGPFGVALGVLGCYTLLRRPLWLWLGSAWIAGITALYFASLGPAVQDAPVFTLPLLLPWAFWIGIGAVALTERLRSVLPLSALRFPLPAPRQRHSVLRPSSFVLPALLLLTLAWGQTRLPYGNKADQWLFRTFGEGVLTEVAPDAVVLTRWEQGTILQYLRLVEGQRPDVWVDIVELEDVSWQERIQARYPQRQVYIIGSTNDAATLGAEYVWGTDYAALFKLPARPDM